jgi:hypothetical protein
MRHEGAVGTKPDRPSGLKPSATSFRVSSSKMTVDRVLRVADSDWVITDSLKSALEDVLVSLGTVQRSDRIESSSVAVRSAGRWDRVKVPMATPRHVAAKPPPLLRLHCEEDRNRVRAFNVSRAKEVGISICSVYLIRCGTYVLSILAYF